MILDRARYIFEHKVLPHYFFQDKQEFLGALMQQQATLLALMMRDVCQELEVECAYQSSDYTVELLQIREDYYAIRVTMPQPSEVPQCFRIYMVFNQACSQQAYFTVEYGEAGQRFMCGWNTVGEHVNYGNCPDSIEAEQKFVQQLFFNN